MLSGGLDSTSIVALIDELKGADSASRPPSEARAC
jgi:asparagine synthetase B (glutamine-hydrolysing)